MAPTTSTRPGRTALASLCAVAVIAAAVGVVAATRHHAARPVAHGTLVLDPAGQSPAGAAPIDADAGTFLGAVVPYRFRLGTTAPDLGAAAAVGRLEAPAVDAARARSIANALGLHGTVQAVPSGGWLVADGGRQLNITPTPGGWSVSEASAPTSLPGSVPGSGGVGTGSSSGSSGASTGAAGAGIVGSGPAVPSFPTTPTTAPTSAPATSAAPTNLPSSDAAERIARALLEHMGVHGDWSVTVAATPDAGGVTCAPQPCATPDHIVLTSLSVSLRPRFEGVTIDGLAWQVVVGDSGTILSVSGTWTNLQPIGRYPLRSVAGVFADLAAGRGIDPEPTPVAAIEPDTAKPPQSVAPVVVTIDRVTLGYAVVPAVASDGGAVDVVPVYRFAGHTADGGAVTRALVAVPASVATPAPVPTTGVPPGSPIPPAVAGGTPVS